MDEKLKEIHQRFLTGKHREAIADLEILITEYANDNYIYKAHDLLGDYFNYMGQHVEEVQSWENSLKSLEDNAGGIEQLAGEQMIDWINISIQTARSLLRQGLE
jgi:hypothetical protein